MSCCALQQPDSQIASSGSCSRFDPGAFDVARPWVVVDGVLYIDLNQTMMGMMIVLLRNVGSVGH